MSQSYLIKRRVICKNVFGCHLYIFPHYTSRLSVEDSGAGSCIIIHTECNFSNNAYKNDTVRMSPCHPHLPIRDPLRPPRVVEAMLGGPS